MTEKELDSAHGEGAVELGIALKVVTLGVWADFLSPADVGDMLRKTALKSGTFGSFFFIFDFRRSRAARAGLARTIPSIGESSGEIP